MHCRFAGGIFRRTLSLIVDVAEPGHRMIPVKLADAINTRKLSIRPGSDILSWHGGCSRSRIEDREGYRRRRCDEFARSDKRRRQSRLVYEYPYLLCLTPYHLRSFKVNRIRDW